MGLKFPTNRNEVSNRIRSDVRNSLPGSNPFLRNSFLLAITFGLSGRIFDLYKTAQNLLNELFWNTATGDFLERHAAIFGIERNVATIATGDVVASGVAGTSIPLGTQLQGSDGETYEVQGTVTLSLESITPTSITQAAGIATVTAPSDHNFAAGLTVTVAGANETEYNGLVIILTVPTASTFTYSVDSGAAGPATGTITVSATIGTLELESISTGQETNKESGEALTFTSPIASVEDTVYVNFGELSGGTDLESDSDFRDRFLFRVQNPVALFNNSAIINEARKISGVTRVWVENVDTIKRSVTASTLTYSGGIATFTTAAPHEIEDGQKVSVSGAVESGYNISGRIVIVLSSTVFVYATNGSPSSPATGTPLALSSLVEEGQVKIFFVRDNDASIIPSSTEIATTKDQILTIKPAHVSDDDVIVRAPTSNTVNFVFTSITPDTPTMRDAVEANLEAFFKDKTEVGRDITLNEIITAIQNTVDPETNGNLTSFVLSAPAADITMDSEELGILGSIAY